MSLYEKSISTPKIFNFSSDNRLSGTNDNFISSPISLGFNKFDTVCLIQSEMPRSFYNIPAEANTFTLDEGGVQTVITLPVGSYSKISLPVVLSALLTASSPNNWVYTMSYPNVSSTADTFKFTWTAKLADGTSPPSQPAFIFGNIMYRQLGFLKNSSNYFVGDTLTSENCINLAYILRAYVKTDLIQDSDYLEEILNYGSTCTLGISYFQQQNFDLNSRVFNNNNSNSWNFSLIDGFGNPILLNGIPWSFSVVFYQRSNTNEVIKSDLMIENEKRLYDISRRQQKILESELITGKDENLQPSFNQSQQGENIDIDTLRATYAPTSINIPRIKKIEPKIKDKKLIKK